jgi:hypothetical protein
MWILIPHISCWSNEMFSYILEETEWNKSVHQLIIDSNNVCDLVREQVCTTEIAIQMQLVALNKICVTEILQ